MIKMCSIADTLKQAEVLLMRFDTARLDAEILLAFCLKQTRTYLFTWSDREVPESEAQMFSLCIERRVAGEPIAYITGEQEFWSLSLKVTPATLIPRPETEQLVDAILARHEQPRLRLWDAGTGSGAIAIALATERPLWQLFASDVSAQALQVAGANVRAQKVNVTLVQGHWLQSVAAKSIDVLVSNPPYIEAGDTHLSALSYEPLSALVADEEGLSDIILLLTQARRVLTDGGFIYLEHGYNQGEQVKSLLLEAGFEAVVCEKDYAGLDRFTRGCWNTQAEVFHE